MVWSVAVTQEAEGHWSELLSRPPITGGNFSATAYAIYALQLYPLAGREAELKERVDRAAKWLCDNAPATHQDRVYQLFVSDLYRGAKTDISETPSGYGRTSSEMNFIPY